MRGPIEYIIDEFTERPDGNTFEEGLAQSDLEEVVVIERVSKLNTVMGVIVTGMGVSLFTAPVSVETDSINDFYTREFIESAIAAGIKAPGFLIGATGVIFTAESLNLWRRSRNRRKELNL